MSFSELELIRRQEAQDLRERGVDPYPSPEFKITGRSADILARFPAEPDAFKDVALAGRLMRKRDMGKAAFIELQDGEGKIQVYLNRDEICPGEDKTLYTEIFKKLTSLGDFIGVTGYVFTTKTGEISIHAKTYQILSKAMRPLPVAKEKDGVVYDAFSDSEQRYRMRYVDLVVNPHVKETFVKRSKLLAAFREFFNGNGWLEVETPILQPLYGGAYARPFTTHHNTLDMKLYLRIANELYLKRLIVGGFEGVYEFAKDFRNEGMSRFHNPEFTMMELYVAYKDYLWLMDMVEELLEFSALKVHGSTQIQVGENLIDFKRPFQRYTLFGSIQHFTGYDLANMTTDEIRAACKTLGIATDATMERAKLIDEIFGACVEPKLIQPTFIMDYPIEMSPLAKKHRSQPGLVERFELMCNSKEICNAYSELNDPVDQRERFEEQLKLRDLGDEEAMMLDEDFLRALEYGMPPTSGLGIGMDRLAMIFTNSASIQDVLFFPQMRPEKTDPKFDKEAFDALGIPAGWQPLLAKLNITNADELKKSDSAQLFSKLLQLKEKLLVDLPPITAQEVSRWR